MQAKSKLKHSIMSPNKILLYSGQQFAKLFRNCVNKDEQYKGNVVTREVNIFNLVQY